MTGGVFISYRRDDSRGSAGRLYDDLRDRLGQGLVFRDIDAVAPGVDYLAEILSTVAQCDALLAVIGRDWVDAKDKAQRRRLDDPADLVRVEIAAALARGKVVIPVLLEDAVMPSAADLPEPLQLLASRNALPISDLRWDYDVGRLASRLEQLVPGRPTPPVTPVAHADRPAGTAARSRVPLALGGVVAGMALLLLVQNVVLGDNGGKPTTTVTNSTSAANSSPGPTVSPSPSAPKGSPGLKAWSESEAVVTSRDGTVTVLMAETLTVGGGPNGVKLAGGQQIPFERMRSLDITAVLPDLGSTLSRAQSVVTLLTGEELTQVIVGFTTLYGSNSLGKFSLDREQLKRVDFRR